MNYLEIAQEVRRGVGMQGTGPASISGASQSEQDIFDAVRDAWLDIQNFRQEWMWMRRDSSFLTVANKTTYTLTEIFGPGYSFKNWIKKTFYVQVNGQWKPLRFIDYDSFIYREQNNTQPKPPSSYTIVPWNDSIIINLPDSDYSIKFDYYKAPQRLALATDVPEMPDYYHVMIKYHAVSKFSVIVVTPEIHTSNSQNYATMMGQLMRDQLMKKKIEVIGIA